MKSILINFFAKILLKIFSRNEKRFFYRLFVLSSESKLTAVLADLTFDDFKTWATVNLKEFLHHRGKNSEGSQKSLAVITFSASFDKVSLNSELERKERFVMKEYKVKLWLWQLCELLRSKEYKIGSQFSIRILLTC